MEVTENIYERAESRCSNDTSKMLKEDVAVTKQHDTIEVQDALEVGHHTSNDKKANLLFQRLYASKSRTVVKRGFGDSFGCQRSTSFDSPLHCRSRHKHISLAGIKCRVIRKRTSGLISRSLELSAISVETINSEIVSDGTKKLVA
uniref:Ovule protein n=1 Tax=Syphacia muris TaxID=451379 RepID=A0A0N5ADV7_9BILA